MLDAVERVLKFNNVKYVRIDGNTPTEQRKYFIDKFQASDDYLFAVLSITSANAGITLTAARRVIFAELHWNPSVSIQGVQLLLVLPLLLLLFVNLCLTKETKNLNSSTCVLIKFLGVLHFLNAKPMQKSSRFLQECVDWSDQPLFFVSFSPVCFLESTPKYGPA